MPTNFTQNIKFSPKPEQLLEEFNFNGGLITNSHETDLNPNQSPDLANVVFNTTGSIKTRNGYLRYNTDPLTSASDQSNTGSSTGTVTLANPGDYAAQTFQLAGNKNLMQVNFYLAMNTAGQEQYMRFELWNTSTSIPSAQLIEEQIQLISGASETTYKFRIREPYALIGSTSYAIVIRPFIRGSTQSINTVKVHRTGAVYANGAAYSSSDAGLTWSAISSVDLKFDILTSTTNVGCTGLIRYYTSTTTPQLISKFGSTLYRGNDITGAMTAITLGSGVSLTAGNFLDWTIFNDTLLTVDGSNKVQKYRGSTNSNYSTGTITATNGSATIAGASTVWNTSTNAAVGEYIQLPDGKWYLITSIASDTSLNIEIQYQGSTLGGQTYKISPWGEVQGQLNTSATPSNSTRPTGNFIATHLNRVWVLQGNSLYFSALDTSIAEEAFNDFDSSNNAGQINIPANKGDVGTGLYSINGYLYIFQRNSIWEIFGTSPANFELRNISNEIGLIDRRTVVEYDTYLLLYSGKDIYIFDGTNLKNLSANRVNSLIGSFANISSSAAVLWNGRYVLSYTPSGGSYNSQAIFYDITNDIFGIFEGVFTSAWSAWNGVGDSGQVYFGSSTQGTIYQWDTGGHDDGFEIETRYNTPSLSFGANSRINDKTVKKVFLQQLALGDWDLIINQYSDITDTITTSSINLADGVSSLWDVAQWGVDSWSDETSLITNRINEFQGTAKYFKYEFVQIGYNEGVQILGINISARVRRLN